MKLRHIVARPMFTFDFRPWYLQRFSSEQLRVTSTDDFVPADSRCVFTERLNLAYAPLRNFLFCPINYGLPVSS